MSSVNVNSTMRELEERRQALKDELNKSRHRIAQQWNVLFTPPQADTKVQHWVNQAERAVAVYDGFMMMYKLGRRFQHISHLFKRKKGK